jgi:hypothetical protein
MWRWSRCTCTRSSCCSSKSCLAAARDSRLYLQFSGRHSDQLSPVCFRVSHPVVSGLQARCCKVHSKTCSRMCVSGWHLDTFICSGSPTAAATSVTPSSTGNAIQSTSARPPHSPDVTVHAFAHCIACDTAQLDFIASTRGSRAAHTSSEGSCTWREHMGTQNHDKILPGTMYGTCSSSTVSARWRRSGAPHLRSQ